MVMVDVVPGISVRPIERGDQALLRSLFGRLSEESVYRRFLSPIRCLDAVAVLRLTDIDHRDREALGAFDGEALVGVARYVRREQPDLAEVAIVVADAFQRRGIGARLLAALREHALAAGITRFAAVAHADNRPALALLRGLDPELRLAVSAGFAEGTLELSR